MSGSSPSDLAVAFRSLRRRLTEAGDDVDPATVHRAGREIEAAVQRAATVLGVAGDGDTVAEEIERRHADEWTDSTLDLLRAAALEAGAVVRRLGAQPKLHPRSD